MLVRLKREELEDRWVAHDAVYPVLCISVGRPDFQGEMTRYRLLTKQGSSTPALHDARRFDIVDPAVSPRWVITVFQDGVLEIEPAAWSGEGFWEAYFDLDDDARARFEQEYRLLVAECGDRVTAEEFGG